MNVSTAAPGVYVEESQSASAPIAGVGTSTPVFLGFYRLLSETGDAAPAFAPKVQFFVNFTEFKSAWFPSAAADQPSAIVDWQGWVTLVHAVQGFFQNGGTGLYVIRGRDSSDAAAVLTVLEAIDDIEIVVAPGVTDRATVSAITDHCAKLKDRVAVLDFPATSDLSTFTSPYATSDYAAAYFPWITVAPIRATADLLATVSTPTPELSALLAQLQQKSYVVPPSGHIAGLYGRVDASRGVHKAPANEQLLGALDVTVAIGDTLQAKVNGQGVNVVRTINGDIRVWGARTLGGSSNNSQGGGDFTYIHVRRLFNFIRSSIKQGTNWVVFEPNTPNVWAKVTRNVSDFLRRLWEQGALFGDTPEQAFFVKCDEETNPPSTRNIGELNAIIGVNITQTAEFVVFELGQWQPGSNQ